MKDGHRRLTLTRGDGEQLWIGDMLLSFRNVGGGRMRVSIEAPPEVRIVRGEIKEEYDRDHNTGGQ